MEGEETGGDAERLGLIAGKWWMFVLWPFDVVPEKTCWPFFVITVFCRSVMAEVHVRNESIVNS